MFALYKPAVIACLDQMEKANVALEKLKFIGTCLFAALESWLQMKIAFLSKIRRNHTCCSFKAVLSLSQFPSDVTLNVGLGRNRTSYMTACCNYF